MLNPLGLHISETYFSNDKMSEFDANESLFALVEFIDFHDRAGLRTHAVPMRKEQPSCGSSQY